ncbi:C-C motif chemokine 20b [Acanthochromis polyacanthus]|uniref:C-C motif chemokine n=1 Tax=Acanthochromis polyacanthus TaxID=80966 RepID=A0A3Q1GDM7_9TELE|nr:C-C motif chemokine 20b [Acanthochromis polyacanthus]
MAGRKVFLIAALCSLLILTTFTGTTESASCCLRYTKRKLHCKRVLGYTIQNIGTACDINAVIFHVPGRFLCANPGKEWAQTAMKCVDERRRPLRSVTKGRTSASP